MDALIHDRIEQLKAASATTRLALDTDAALARLLAAWNDPLLADDFKARVREASACPHPARALCVLAPLMHPIPMSLSSETRCELEALAGAALWRFSPDLAVVRSRAVRWFLEYAAMRAELLKPHAHTHKTGCPMSDAQRRAYAHEARAASEALRSNKLTPRDVARQAARLAAVERLLAAEKHAITQSRHTLMGASIVNTAKRALTNAEALVTLAPFLAMRSDADCEIVWDIFTLHDDTTREQAMEAFCTTVLSPISL